MEYLSRAHLRYEHVARHARSIPGTPVFHVCLVDLLTLNTMCDFERGGAKKSIIGSS